ncbi:charged multivesicular body protein 6 [Sitophilus oryzae]|uniref:Charged multivesicular body protein 6 n=1 Tax=Sitophilus oryzae TaxID=7048 RepID=A0A6J2XTS5_SITOR|nr:charged multivesicular body protein 6 [Sitophilus oryzae]
MGIIFGKKKPPSRITAQDKAVLQLKQQRDKLKQYQRRIENSLASDREIAKKLLAKGQKDRAKLLLRKKRYQEQLLVKTDGQLENLEKLTHDIEFAQIELEVVEGLKKGNEALKKVNDALNIEDIEKILDETREAKEKQDEISSLLSGVLTDEDEEAVENELADILKEQMPEVPSNEVVSGEVSEEEEQEPTKKEKAKQKSPTEPVALEA